MSENPWWHPADDDDWDEPLPPVVTLEPDYHAKLPLGGTASSPGSAPGSRPSCWIGSPLGRRSSIPIFTGRRAGIRRTRGTDGQAKPRISPLTCARSWELEPNFSCTSGLCKMSTRRDRGQEPAAQTIVIAGTSVELLWGRDRVLSSYGRNLEQR